MTPDNLPLQRARANDEEAILAQAAAQAAADQDTADQRRAERAARQKLRNSLAGYRAECTKRSAAEERARAKLIRAFKR